MKAYSVFDDFPKENIIKLNKNGIEVTLNPKGAERPAGEELKKIIEEYDIVIISTAQKISEDMLSGINDKKIIATASVGTDHISVPYNKKDLIKVVNAPGANRISVAEHTFGLIIALRKQFADGRKTAFLGKSKKEMKYKPHDLFGSSIGVIGAGGIGSKILEMAECFGMKKLCWTRNPESHQHLLKNGVQFTKLDYLLSNSDVISVNLPLTKETENLISKEKVELIKNDATFISISRPEVTDNEALFEKAKEHPEFMLGMDVDADKILKFWDFDSGNVIITPHIAGGTVESRIRLFNELTENILI